MWFILGVMAMITAGINVIFTLQGKDARRACFASLSFTALTVCAFYADVARCVGKQDWSALMDVTPTVSVMLWICVIASILINSISIFGKGES